MTDDLNDKEKQDAQEAINIIEAEMTGIAITLSKSLSRINDLQVEVEKIKKLMGK